MATATFSPYLLKSILTLLLTDEEYREQFFPILKAEHFNSDDRMVSTVAQAIWLMNDKYGTFPSPEALVDEVFKQKGINIDLFQSSPSKDELIALFDFVSGILEDEVTDRKYVEDNTLRILGFLSVQKVILDHKEEFKSGSIDVEEFTKEIVTAGTFVTPVKLGVNLYDNLDKRTEERNNTDVTPGLIELNIPHLAQYIEEGGMPPGSLGFFLAPSNGGKTSALIHTAHDAAFHGHNVLFVSAELSETLIMKKFDACMTGIPSNTIKKQAGHVRGKIISSPQFINTAKRIQVVEVPMGTTKVSEIDVLVERLKRKGFNTDLLIVDYADNLRPEKKSEYRHEITSIYQNLIALSQKHNLVVWTASQMNDAGTEAAEKKGGIVTMRHVNEARGKIQLATLCIAIARTQEEKDGGFARLVMVKNRLGDHDGAQVSVTTRFDIARLFGEDKNVVPMEDINVDAPIAGLEGLSLPPVSSSEREQQDREPISLADRYKIE
jgi:replicative DNA helicase